MRRPAPELPPLRAGVAAAALLALVAPAARAQETEPFPADPLAFASAGIGTTHVAGGWMPTAEGTLWLRVATRYELGGAGRVGLGSRGVNRGGSRVRLHFGYAGLLLGVAPAPARWPGLRVTTLLGAGNASTTDPAGTLLDSDIGVVVEPAARYALHLARRVDFVASASWRYARGFRVLGGVRSRDLRGPAAGASISVGPF